MRASVALGSAHPWAGLRPPAPPGPPGPQLPPVCHPQCSGLKLGGQASGGGAQGVRRRPVLAQSWQGEQAEGRGGTVKILPPAGDRPRRSLGGPFLLCLGGGLPVPAANSAQAGTQQPSSPGPAPQTTAPAPLQDASLRRHLARGPAGAQAWEGSGGVISCGKELVVGLLSGACASGLTGTTPQAYPARSPRSPAGRQPAPSPA